MLFECISHVKLVKIVYIYGTLVVVLIPLFVKVVRSSEDRENDG